MINKIIYFSIKNKALIWLMVIGLIVGGIYSMTKVPLDAVPDITNNQVLVITTAPNLGTEDIEKFVTYQVELAVANLPGVKEIRSVSRFGLSVVTIVFDDNEGTYLPRQLVNEALNEVKERIPDGFGKPFMAPISSGLGEIYQYTLEVQPGFEKRYKDVQLRTMQDWIVKRQMAMVPGVVEVNSFGGHVKQYEVAVNPDKLRSMGISIAEIFDALEKNNQNTGGAYIEKNYQANFIRGEGLMRSLDDIKNTMVKNINGNPIFIRDVATVKFGNFVRYGAFTKDGKGEAVGGIIMMLKGANSNNVIKDVKKRMAQIEKSLPKGIKIKSFLDRSKLIKSTTSTVTENLALGALIVIFVLVIFLGNLRGGLIVASTIPLALLFAFIMMNIFGVWANLMSLGSLDFGILVDGSLIIVENMIFYLHRKNLIGTNLQSIERDKIAYKSASKMMNSAFFGQVIILIVFIPVLVLQGVEGKMFIPMAQVFAFAVFGVMLLSLTYIPMLAATLLRSPKTDKKSFGDKAIIYVENIYRRMITWLLKRAVWVVSLAFASLLGAGFLFTHMGAEFIPKLDEGDFAFQMIMKPGTALTEVTENSTKVENLLLKNFPDEIESILGRIGVASLPMDPMPMDIADVFVIVKPKSQWTKAKSKKELIEKIEKKLKIFTGINFEFTQPIEMRFNELLTGVREDVAIKIYGDDLNVLADKAKEIAKLVSGIKGVSGVKPEATRGLPQITVRYDRNKLGRYGLNINDMNKIIESAFSGGVAGRIYEGERMFDLVVRLDKQHRTNIDDIRNLFVSLPDGNQIPLKELATISYQPGPMQISRDNTKRRTYVGINVKDRDVKSLVKEIQATLDKKLELPVGYYIRYGGAFENLERATKRLTLVVPLALSLIFILVFFAIKSFKQTLMIYIAIPFAAVGGIVSLYLLGMPFSISAGVGFIVLFGVAVLNGLVLISGYNELKAEGKYTLQEIITQGSVRRIRPILLTATVDMLGFLPMAISTSAGAEVQRPLATVVIGGMLTSTFLTLVVLPILYNWVEKNKKQKFPKLNTTVLGVILFVGLLGFSRQTKAQDTTFTLQQSIEILKKNYPAIKAAQLNVAKQKALKATAYDLGRTSVYTGKEEYGNGVLGIHNQFGIEQNDIDLLGIPAKTKLAQKRTELALSAKELTVYALIRNLRISWYRAYYAKQQTRLFQQLDSLYANFLHAAELKYKTNESSKIEYLSASSRYNRLKVEIKMAEKDYRSALQMLNQYLMFPGDFDINAKGMESDFTKMDTESLSGSPVLSFYSKSEDLAKSAWKAEQSEYFPKLDVSYKKQVLDGISGFKGWQVGVSIPLIFFSQAGKTKASQLDYKIAGQNLEEKKLEINSQYKQLINEYSVLVDLIDYYKNKALPLANEQIHASQLGYKLGSIDYVQFIQNIEMAIDTKKEFLAQQNQLFQLSAKIKFIRGE